MLNIPRICCGITLAVVAAKSSHARLLLFDRLTAAEDKPMDGAKQGEQVRCCFEEHPSRRRMHTVLWTVACNGCRKLTPAHI